MTAPEQAAPPAVGAQQPPCTQCGEPVDLSRPYVRIAITVQTQRRGATYTHARNVLGTWHKRCARSWPVPLQRNAPIEENDHA
jgi:hypothetical protein